MWIRIFGAKIYHICKYKNTVDRFNYGKHLFDKLTQTWEYFLSETWSDLFLEPTPNISIHCNYSNWTYSFTSSISSNSFIPIMNPFYSTPSTSTSATFTDKNYLSNLMFLNNLERCLIIFYNVYSFYHFWLATSTFNTSNTTDEN